MRREAGLAALLVILAIPGAAPPVRAQGPSVAVLADFGDGTYLWADVELPPTNVTALKATELANDGWSLPPLEVTWFESPFCRRSPCAFVTDIGDRNATYPLWWHFYVWNGTEWEVASYGPSDTDLGDGAAIAWYLAEDDPETFAAPRPVPRPAFREVWTSFRGDLENRGFGRGSIPVTGRELWRRTLCPGVECGNAPLEIDAAPIAAYGMVFAVMRGWVLALDAETGVTVWANRSLGGLLSTPAVYDGRLFFGGAYGRFHAVDAFTGRELWSLALEPGGGSTGIASSPSVYRGRAYVGTFNESAGGRGRVVAVNLNNGTVAWAYDAPGAVHMSSPAIRNGSLYVGIMGTYDGAVDYDPPFGLLSLGLDGTFRWFYETDGPVASSPALGAGRVYFADKAGFLYALREDGSLDWRRSIGPSTSSPALAGDRLFLGSGTFAGGGNASAWVWSFDLAGNELWRAGVSGPVQASVVTDGRLVCGGTNWEFGDHFCLRADDGSRVWIGPLIVMQGSYVLGSPTFAGGTLFAANDAGTLVAYRDAAPEEYPLATVRIEAEGPLQPGAGGRLRVWVQPLAAIYRVTLRVTLPAGLRLLNESEPSGPRTFPFDLGDLGSEEGSVVLDVWAMEGHASWTVRASVSYVDFAGRSYPDRVAEETIAAAIPPPDLGGSAWALLGIAVVAATVVAALLWRARRRRPKEGPPDA